MPKEDEPLFWLAYSELITPLIKRRLLGRLVMILAYLGVSGSALATDVTGKIGPSLAGLDAYDLLIGISQILVALLGSTLFIGEPEATFMRNLSALNDHLYSEYVVRAIRKFNAGVADLDIVKCGRLMTGLQEMRVRAVVDEEVRRKLKELEPKD